MLLFRGRPSNKKWILDGNDKINIVATKLIIRKLLFAKLKYPFINFFVTK